MDVFFLNFSHFVGLQQAILIISVLWHAPSLQGRFVSFQKVSPTSTLFLPCSLSPCPRHVVFLLGKCEPKSFLEFLFSPPAAVPSFWDLFLRYQLPGDSVEYGSFFFFFDCGLSSVLSLYFDTPFRAPSFWSLGGFIAVPVRPL